MEKIRQEILDSIMEDVEEELSDEEMLHLILEKRVSRKVGGKEKYTLGQRAADRLAKFAGSWIFVIGFAMVLVIWILFNNSQGSGAFDPFPFILLNLVLSCIAAIQAPLIMMSQNRQEEIDRNRAENDYKVNLKTEIIIEDLHRKLDDIIATQENLTKALKNIQGQDDILILSETSEK